MTNLRNMTHEQLVAECCYRGAELVIERQKIALFKKQLARRFERAWTDFLDANPDDLTGLEEYPDHALMTFEQAFGLLEASLDGVEAC